MKLKSGGNSRPFGSFVLGSRSSSKKQCAQDSTGMSLVDGVYSNNLLHKLIASGGVLGLKTCKLEKNISFYFHHKVNGHNLRNNVTEIENDHKRAVILIFRRIYLIIKI